MLRTADNHSVYKNGAKEIAALHGKSLTFMAKFDEREGNSCHVHLSLRRSDGAVVFDHGGPAGTEAAAGSGHPERGLAGGTPLFDQFIAGVLATLPEFSLLYAPNINSYKRFQPGSFAPTAVAWGHDNRTCALRVVGHGPGLRVENRMPGGDMNPYLGLAAMLAGGLHGIAEALPLAPAFEGNAHLDVAQLESGHPAARTRRDRADLHAGAEHAAASS